MRDELIVRAWKDPLFRASLDDSQRAELPPNPAGAAFVDLAEGELVSWTFAVTCLWFTERGDVLQRACRDERAELCNCGETMP